MHYHSCASEGKVKEAPFPLEKFLMQQHILPTQNKKKDVQMLDKTFVCKADNTQQNLQYRKEFPRNSSVFLK